MKIGSWLVSFSDDRRLQVLVGKQKDSFHMCAGSIHLKTKQTSVTWKQNCVHRPKCDHLDLIAVFFCFCFRKLNGSPILKKTCATS